MCWRPIRTRSLKQHSAVSPSSSESGTLWPMQQHILPSVASLNSRTSSGVTPLMVAYALPFVRLKNKAGHSHEHAQNRDAHGDVRIVEHCTDRDGAQNQMQKLGI